MQFYSVPLRLQVYLAASRLVHGPHLGGTIAPGDADTGRIRPAIRVEQEMDYSLFSVGCHRVIGSGGSAVPEAYQVIAMTDQHHGIIRQQIWIIRVRLGCGHSAMA